MQLIYEAFIVVLNSTSGDIVDAKLSGYIESHRESHGMKTSVFNLGNLCCISCAEEVQRALRSNPNISAARVDYRSDTASVTYKEELEREQKRQGEG